MSYRVKSSLWQGWFLLLVSGGKWHPLACSPTPQSLLLLSPCRLLFWSQTFLCFIPVRTPVITFRPHICKVSFATYVQMSGIRTWVSWGWGGGHYVAFHNGEHFQPRSCSGSDLSCHREWVAHVPLPQHSGRIRTWSEGQQTRERASGPFSEAEPIPGGSIQQDQSAFFLLFFAEHFEGKVIVTKTSDNPNIGTEELEDFGRHWWLPTPKPCPTFLLA